MRVLILAYETPTFPAGGGNSRQHCLLEPLASRHDIRVVSTGGRPGFGALPRGVEVEFIDPVPDLGQPEGGWIGKNLRHYLSGTPWLYRSAIQHYRALAGRLPEEMASFRPDLVQVEHGELGPLLALVPITTATVLSLPDAMLTVQYQQLFLRGAWYRVKSGLELPVMMRQTRRDLRTAAVTVAATDRDGRILSRAAPFARVRVVANCTNTAYFERQAEPSPSPRVVFPASFQHPPNVVAARELLTVTWPAVRRRFAGAELVLVGQGMPDDLLALVEATPGALALGSVPDVRPELWSAWLLAAPLRFGSGSPLKVVEAMAAGLPVVTTERVAAALGMGADEGITAARGPEDFAKKVSDLLADDDRRRRLAAAGLRAVGRYDRALEAPKLEAVWHEAVDSRRA